MIYLLRKLCVQISGTPGGTSLPLISFSILEILKSPIHQVQWPRRSLRFPKMLPKALGGSTSSSTSTGPMTQNKAKAIRLLTSQEVEGKAPVTKLISAPAQPKTVISLNTLRTSKYTSSRRGDSAFALEDSTIGSEYHYSASDARLSTPS